MECVKMYYVIVFTLLTWAVTSSGMFHRDLYIRVC